MKKAIFVYGLCGNEKHSRVAKKILSNYEVLTFNYNSWLKQSVKEIAKELEIFIDKATKSKEKVNLIGVSAGGIIASYYVKLIAPNKVNKLATICSPLGGSYLPKLYPKKLVGLQEMSRGSILLSNINESKLKTKEINFYSKLDLLVPGDSGKGKNPVHTKNFWHFTIQNDKKILRKIKEFFGK